MSAPLTLTTFRGWYPEFDDVPDGSVDRQLALANMTLSPSAWGKWLEQALGLFTAHYLAVRFNISAALQDNGVRSPTSSIGTVTNKSATTSGISEGSANSALVTGDDPLAADFARTEYGLEYLSLMEMVIPAGGVLYSPSTAAAGRRRF